MFYCPIHRSFTLSSGNQHKSKGNEYPGEQKHPCLTWNKCGQTHINGIKL